MRLYQDYRLNERLIYASKPNKQRMEQLARKPLRVLVCFIRHAIAIAIVERISCFLFRAGYLDSWAWEGEGFPRGRISNP